MTVGLPVQFCRRMETLLGNEAGDLLAALQEPPRQGLRLNPLKVKSPGDLALPFTLEPVPWCPEGFVIREADAHPGRHPYHAAGLYYLQDPSAMAAAVLLAPQPGEVVLDLCAAPGGKATHILACLQDDGLLIANEIVPGRARTLVENLERWGSHHFLVCSEKAGRLAECWPERFDCVLVDAPCSGEGMFRKSPEARQEWSPEHVLGCARRQTALLRDAARLLRPGGRLLYATCTFAPEENEAVIARFLREHPGFSLLPPPPLPGMAEGRPDWVAPELRRGLALERCVRIWPHRVQAEGHFFALLQKAGEGVPASLPAPRLTLPATAWGPVQAFWQETVGQAPPDEGWAQYGEWLHLLPVDPSFWQGLRPLRAGLRVGRLRKGRFQPHHALALSRLISRPIRAVHLTADDPRLGAYLRGETFGREGKDGWVAVCVEGYAVGWGRLSRGVLKNYYPKGLRRR
ncbi:MAG: SAM-dependent methyltransferase [Caldilineae bacterium]|nr:MAG: SAM-dependent methyltransferase [Caldilineae bacterium]